MTNFVDCKLMLTKSLRCMLLLEMSIFCKYKSLSNANLSNSQFDRIDFSYDTIAKEIIGCYLVLGDETNNPIFLLETLLLKSNKLKQNNLQ